jgi:transposase
VSVDDGLGGHSCLCPQRGIVDTSDQTLEVQVQGTKKRRRTIRERREIVEQTLLPGASVSRVARRHDVNANQLFYWRKLYREGHLGSNADTQLVPVKVANDRSVEAAKDDDFLPRSGTREIQLATGKVHIAGRVDLVVLRTALEYLLG